jgi:ferric-dicitrate binding protein FerR (iron transport regulator)
MAEEITREMLFSYFANELTAIQKRRIEDWVKQGDNLELFYECLALWESQNLQYHSDVEAALKKHQARLELRSQVIHIEGHGKKAAGRKTSWVVAAASLFILLALSGYFAKDAILTKTLATADGEKRSFFLSDSTWVTLNSNSSLVIPRFGFGDHTRNVFLTGEANFSVAHLPTKQKFVVKTAEGTDIVVLGTEFTVYSRQSKFKVALIKGKIQLNYKESKLQKNLIMSPGDLVTINSPGGKAVVEKTTHPERLEDASDNRYVFDHTPLQEVCDVLKKDFNIDIEIASPEISTWSISGSFKASNAQDLLEELTQSSGLVYEQQGDRIIIRTTKE